MSELPNSSEAERAILGGIILNSGRLSQAIELLRLEDFYLPSHRNIFKAMIALFERGAEINPILIGEELKRASSLESCGGISYITNLTFGLPHSTSIEHYAKVVREKTIARSVLKATATVTAQILEGNTAEAVEWGIRTLTGLSVRGNDKAGLSVIRMADVEREDVDWLWHPYIAFRKLTLLEGDPGIGKSWITAALACAVSRGTGLAGMQSEPGNVLMLSAEDGLGDTLRPRLDAVGADVSRVFALDEPLTFDAGGLLLLEAAILKYQAFLVTVDPLFAFTGGKVDINRANECRTITARLAQIAEKHNCAIVGVRHLGKSRGMGHALNAGIGSIDITAAARSVLLAGKDPDDENKRAIVQIKSNLAPPGPAIGFTLRGGEFFWTGESDLTDTRILSYGASESKRPALDEAAEFLREELADGECEATSVKANAKRAGITYDTLRQAKAGLGIKSVKRGAFKAARWVWVLPKDADVLPEDVYKIDDPHLRTSGANNAGCDNDLAEDAEGSDTSHLREGNDHHRDGYSLVFAEQWRQGAWESWNAS